MNNNSEDLLSFTRRGFLTTTTGIAASAFATKKAKSQEATVDSGYKIGFPLEQQWLTEYTDSFGGGSPRVTFGTVADGIMYIKLDSTDSDPAKIVARNIESNSDIWETTAGDYVSPPTVVDDTLLVSVVSHLKAYPASEESTSTLWEYESDMDIVAWPTRMKNKFVVAEYNYEPREGSEDSINYNDGRLSLFDKDGNQQWSVEGEHIENPILYNDSIIHYEGRQYGSDGEYKVASGRVVSRDFETGERQWESSDFNILNIRSTASELILAHSRNDSIRGIDTNSGTVEWTISTRGDVRDFAAGPDTLYFGIDENLRAVDFLTGNEIWSKSGLEPGDIRYYGGLVFVGTVRGDFYAVDADTGEIVWETSQAMGQGYLRIREGNVYTFSQNSISKFVGERGKAMTALRNARSTSGFGIISSGIADLLGRRQALSQAETYIENYQYEAALNSISSATLRTQAVEATAATLFGGTVYTGARIIGTRIQRRRLYSSLQQAKELYPIESGALKGLQPEEIIQQGSMAQEEIKKVRLGSSLSALATRSDDYTEPIKKLNRAITLHEDLLDLSNDIAKHDDEISVQAWKNEFEQRLTDDLNRIDQLLKRGNQAVSLTEGYRRLGQSNSEEIFELIPLVSEIQSAQSPTGDNQHPVEYIEAALDTVETFTTAQNDLNRYDLTTVKNHIQNNIDVAHSDYSSAAADLVNIEKLLSLATDSETDRVTTDFTHSDLSAGDIQGWIQNALHTVSLKEMEEIQTTITNLKRGVWRTEHLHAYSPYEFEDLISDLYKDLGYQTHVTTEGSDGGVDVIAEGPSEKIIIQVKQYSPGNNIGRPTIQQTAGVRDQFGADKAIVVTSSNFTSTAKEASMDYGHQMKLINGDSLKNMLSRSSLIPPVKNYRGGRQ